jgi:predicted alpha/beta-hydrolase family hydrolase
MHPPGAPTPRNPGIDRLGTLRVPVLVVQGDQDPLGDLRVLYSLAADAKTPPKIVVVPGDHGFQEGGADDPRTADNIDLAVRALVLWSRRFAGA